MLLKYHRARGAFLSATVNGLSIWTEGAPDASRLQSRSQRLPPCGRADHLPAASLREASQPVPAGPAQLSSKEIHLVHAHSGAWVSRPQPGWRGGLPCTSRALYGTLSDSKSSQSLSARERPAQSGHLYALRWRAGSHQGQLCGEANSTRGVQRVCLTRCLSSRPAGCGPSLLQIRSEQGGTGQGWEVGGQGMAFTS